MCACHPILWAIGVALAFWACLFLPQYIYELKAVRTPGIVITLTPWKRNIDGTIKKPEEVHEFDPRLEHYLKVAEIIVGLASASLVFVPTMHSKNINPFWFAFALVLLSFTVFFGLFFMATMTYFYEMFLFKPSSYGAGRSSLMFSLGFSGFACFAAAYFVIGVQIAVAYMNGTLTTPH
jgi:hypothetical protein